MKMRYMVFMLGLGGAAGASAADAGFYVGGGYGHSEYSGDIAAQLQAAYAGVGNYRLVAAQLPDDSDNGWKLFTGYRFGNGFGLELSRVDLGQAQSDYHVQVVGTVTPVVEYLLQGHYEAKGYGLAAFYEWEFTPALSGLVRAGVFQSSLDYSEATYAGASYAFAHDGSSETGPAFGLGLNWRITPAVDLRLDYDRYQDIGERVALTEDGNGRFGHVDLLSLNLAFRFGK